jgi:hypothetical protein
VVELLRQAIPATVLVVAVDPGKVSNRVWLTSGERGLIGEPVSLPVLGEGITTLAGLMTASGVAGPPTIAVEATGRVHRAWVAELERRRPGSVRLFAPSETQAARAQLGSRRYKTDDRDCAALVWLARQGAGRPVTQDSVEGLIGAVRHRRGLVADRKVLQQRLHDQLQALCPGPVSPRRPWPRLGPGGSDRPGLPEHRDALMGIAWGLSQYSHSCAKVSAGAGL